MTTCWILGGKNKNKKSTTAFQRLFFYSKVVVFSSTSHLNRTEERCTKEKSWCGTNVFPSNIVALFTYYWIKLLSWSRWSVAGVWLKRFQFIAKELWFVFFKKNYLKNLMCEHIPCICSWFMIHREDETFNAKTHKDITKCAPNLRNFFFSIARQIEATNR